MKESDKLIRILRILLLTASIFVVFTFLVWFFVSFWSLKV